MAGDPKVLELDLADGTHFRLRGWRATETWYRKLEDAWAFLEPGRGNGPSDIRPNTWAWFKQIERRIRQGIDSGEAPASAKEDIQRAFAESWGPMHPDSQDGQRVLGIYDDLGEEAAMFAWLLIRNHFSIRNATTIEFLRAAMIVAWPASAKNDQLAARINSERAGMKRDVRATLSRLDDEEANRQAVFETLLAETAERGLASAKRRSERLLRYASDWKKVAQAAINSIQAVELFYKEEMRLKASVDYWTGKARTHKEVEEKRLVALYVYFPIAFLLVSGIFGAVGYYLINHAPAKIPSSAYFVATGGLASAAGILLWVGRLLTKLYLSEHHLRHDAEERAVMTTTYLALTAEKGVEEVDRQIILNALFRNTSDGIVKDDGALDPSIAAALAKFLAK